MKKKHIPAELWTKILGKMVEYHISTAQVTIPIDVCTSTFYSKKKEYFNGGVKPRKPGSVAKRKYETKDYEQFLRNIVNSLPPIFGTERIWMKAKRLGSPFGQTVCHRMLKELGLLLPREKGRSRKRYEPLLVDSPNQVYLIDTTIWVVGQNLCRYGRLFLVDSLHKGLPGQVGEKRRWNSTRKPLRRGSRRRSTRTMGGVRQPSKRRLPRDERRHTPLWSFIHA